MRSTDRTPVRDALAIGVTVGVLGCSFGALAVAGGVSVGMACAMSALVFTGGAQFLALGVVGAGGGALAALAAGLLLNARCLPFGLALAGILGGGRLRRAAASQLVIDESAALALAQPRPADRERAFWAAGLAVFVAWNAGTALGALAGGALGDPAAWGLDAAFPAAILALLVPQLGTRAARAAAAAGAALALACTPLLPAGAPILVAALGGAVGWAVGRR